MCVKLSFPNELLVPSTEELLEYRDEECIRFPQSAYEGWDLRFAIPNQPDVLNGDKKFVSLDELTTVYDIVNLLAPTDVNKDLSIFSVEVLFEPKEVKHRYYKIKEI